MPEPPLHLWLACEDRQELLLYCIYQANPDVEGNIISRYNEMTTNAEPPPLGDVKKSAVDSITMKGTAFERLPDEIIEQ